MAFNAPPQTASSAAAQAAILKAGIAMENTNRGGGGSYNIRNLNVSEAQRQAALQQAQELQAAREQEARTLAVQEQSKQTAAAQQAELLKQNQAWNIIRQNQQQYNLTANEWQAIRGFVNPQSTYDYQHRNDYIQKVKDVAGVKSGDDVYTQNQKLEKLYKNLGQAGTGGRINVASREAEAQNKFPVVSKPSAEFLSSMKPTTILTSSQMAAANKLSPVSYENVNQYLKEHITYPAFQGLKNIGFDVTNETWINKQGGLITTIKTPIISDIDKLYKGAVRNIAIDIKEQPFKQALEFGAGVALGFGVSAGVRGATYLEKYTGDFALGAFTKDLTSVGGLALTGVYGVDVGTKVAASKDLYEAGGIVGVSLKDLGLVGYGAVKGQQAYQQVSGYLSTRGRTEIPFEKLTTKGVLAGTESFPLAHGARQIELFEKNIFGKELNEPAGAFHTTPERFSTSKLLEPQVGSSELPGLYGSSSISPHFAKITGAGSSAEFKLFDISLSTGKPGVAYLEPLGFREVGFKKVNPYQIADKTFKFDFKSPAKLGYADIPNMKQEVEAIFRTDAGSYEFASGKYYTNINKVRVPIDVFKSAAGKGTGDIVLSSLSNKNLLGSSYSYPGRYSAITPETLAVISLLSGRKSLAPILRSSLAPSRAKSDMPGVSSAKDFGYSTITYGASKSASSLTSDIPASIISRVSNLSSNLSYAPSVKRAGKSYSDLGLSSNYNLYPARTGKYKRDNQIKRSMRRELGFDVFEILKGKPKVIARGLSMKSALDIGTKETLGTLRASFFLRKSDLPVRSVSTRNEFARYRKLFREPTKTSRLRKYGNVFVQKQYKVPGLGRGRLSFKGELKEIQSTRRRRKLRVGID